MTQTTTTCIGCETSRTRGRTTCFWCGTALGCGRDPSDSERFETSPEGRQARVERSMSSRREPAEIDACVAEAIQRTLRAGAEFTHEDLVGDTGLNGCAIKYSLERLQRTGLVRAAGRVQVRSQRFRTIWRVEGATARSGPTRVADDGIGATARAQARQAERAIA